MKYILLLGRVCFSLIFITSGFNHFSRETIAYAAAHGAPMPDITVPLSGIIAIIGGVSIATGFKGKIGGTLIALFLIPITLYMHNFWVITDPQEHMLQMIMFMKNLSMLGGSLIVAYFGAGPVSIDAWTRRKAVPDETHRNVWTEGREIKA